MSKTHENRWGWGDLDPPTRTFIAAFSGCIGVAEGEFPISSFVAAMTETFPDVTKEHILKSLQWVGSAGIRNCIVNWAGSLEQETVTKTFATIGELAGGTEALSALAMQAGRQFCSQAPDTVPTLLVLTELAMLNCITTPR